MNGGTHGLGSPIARQRGAAGCLVVAFVYPACVLACWQVMPLRLAALVGALATPAPCFLWFIPRRPIVSRRAAREG